MPPSYEQSIVCCLLTVLLSAGCSETPIEVEDPTNTPGAGKQDHTGDTRKLTALQKHVSFFDRNFDGQITVDETEDGLIAIGIDSLSAGPIAVSINGGVGAATGATLEDPLTISVADIHFAKHGSDSDIFDEQGEFSKRKFDELFDRNDRNGDDILDNIELERFYLRNKDPFDFVGSVASRLEFGLLLKLAGEEVDPGLGWFSRLGLSKARLAAFYDGTLFFTLAGERVPF